MWRVALVLLCLGCVDLLAEDRVVRLYEGAAPGSEDWTHAEQENRNNLWRTPVIFNVVDPTLTVFEPDPAKRTGTGLIICPGGGFHALSIDSEGFDVARWLAARGVTCFVLKYRLVECKTDDPTTEIMIRAARLDKVVAPIVKLAMADGLAAVGHVRRHAQDYGVRPDRIGIIGFSAGGTVTASVAFNYTRETRPDFAAPIYLQYEWVPEGAVPADAPPLFILAATNDPLGLATHSLDLYRDWTSQGKSAELHIYAKGGHGFGMRKQGLPSDHWIKLFADWLQVQGLMQKQN